MQDDDMIVPPADDAVDTGDQNDDNKGDDQGTSQEGEVSGTLIDNDEVQDDKPTPAEDAEKPGEGREAPETDEGPEAQKPESPQLPPTKTVDESAAKLEDPGEFQPKDYSFDITLADGSVHRITKPEDVKNLPQDADFGTPANLMEAQANLSRMTVNIDQDKREFESKQAAFKEQQEADARLTESVNTMVAEMDYLVSKGKLPKVDSKFENADWSDPEVQKQPGVKEALELLEYRGKENEQRAKLGLPPMSVLEAAKDMELEGYRQKAEETKQRQSSQRKAKGAMVGGASASPHQSMPDDMIVGAGGNIRDIG